MPRYFFHVWKTEGIEADKEGVAFESLGAAEADARASLFEMMADDLAHGEETSYLAIEITDSLGSVLAVVKAIEALKGRR